MITQPIQPKVSIILPIYNQERFLQTALDSLSGQTLHDTEYICINDGSTDKSLQILTEQAKKDKRFKIIDQPNQGTGIARNNGLRMAQGEYIGFLDPDDWFEKDALSSLYKEAKEQDCDMLVFDYKKVDEGGNLLKKVSIAERVQRVFTLTDGAIFNWKDIKGKLFGGLYFSAWNKLYRRDFVESNKLHFAKCSFAEDSPFVLGATLNAKRIGYSTTPHYNYLIHDCSAIRTNKDQNLCVFKSFDAIKRVLRICGLAEELSDEFDTYIVKRCNMDIHKVASKDTFERVRHQRLSPSQNKSVDNLRATGAQILNILDSLKIKK